MDCDCVQNSMPAQDGTLSRTVSRASRAVHGRMLPEPEAYLLLARYGIEVPRWRYVTDEADLARAAEEVGFPAVVKVVSPDIVHKSDVGGVVLGVGSGDQAVQACRKIRASVQSCRPDAAVAGWLVTQQVVGGVELVAGMVRDAVFGPVLMFGSGGILVELLRDVVFRAIPIDERDAREMISETRAQALLRGVRGRPQADEGAVVRLLLGLSRLVGEHPEIEEIDLNPVLATATGAVAVDARLIVCG